MDKIFILTSGTVGIKRIVTSEKGSWRWQDAFRVSEYRPRRTRSGRWIWSSAGTSGKMSEPQLRRAGAFGRYHVGSAHNQGVDLNLFVVDMAALVEVGTC